MAACSRTSSRSKACCWLHGIGDAARVGIVGASFGGYSTLLGITFQPELFKVGVALVPPPDFASTLRWIQRNWSRFRSAAPS